MALEEKMSQAFRIKKMNFTGIQEEEEERFHPFHEFYYVAEGSCSVFIGHRSYRLSAGDFAIIPVGVLHKTDYLSLGQNTKYVVSFSTRLARQVDTFLGEPITAACMKSGRVRAPAQRQEGIRSQMNRMLYEYENQPEHSMSVCRAILCGIMISIIRYRAGEEENDGTVSPENERMQAVADYITLHAAEDLSLAGLSSVFALSPSHLSRTFRKATGFGLREFLVHTRIQMACSLLLTTGLSITEIAAKCGFTDSNYFGDAFKKAMGVSPREYRKIAE